MPGAIDSILSAVVLILGIFGMLYMFTETVKGILIILFCGGLIFLRAFLKKSKINW